MTTFQLSAGKLVSLLALVMMTIACNPLRPEPIEGPPKVPAGSLEIPSVPIPDSTLTFQIWITKFNPERDGGQLVAGKTASIEWTEDSQATGYMRFISVIFIEEGKPLPSYVGLAGSAGTLGFSKAGAGIDVVQGTKNILGVRFLIWIRKGGTAEDINNYRMQNPPNFIRDIPVNWKAPV